MATETEEIRPQVVEIETSSEIKGTVIEKEVPLAGIGEVSILLTPNKKRKRSSVRGESYRRRIPMDSLIVEVVSVVLLPQPVSPILVLLKLWDPSLS